MSTLIDQNTLATLVPINSLSPENLQELVKKTKVETIAAGRYIFKKGDEDKRNIYLLSGSIELLDDKKLLDSISHKNKKAKLPIAHSQPRRCSARAKEDCKYVSVDSNLLDIMMTWDQTGTYHVEELSVEKKADNDEDWMTQLLQTEAFMRVPPANIQAIFMRMEQVEYKPGDVVVKQGEDGDYFYILRSGRAMVTRATRTNPKGAKLAELGPGDSFGEESLLSQAKRSASVTMLQKGALVRLSKNDFMSLLNEPIQNWIDFPTAKKEAAEGKLIWLDARLPSEYKLGHLKGSINVPLISMRLKLKSLNKSKQYAVYCDTGRRSSAAAFMMSKNGFECKVLKNGLTSVPDQEKTFK